MIKIDRQWAVEQDRNDPLAAYRKEFHIPLHLDGEPQVYFCGNSLGLQPRRLHAAMDQELRSWAELGVAGHFEGEFPWKPYHEFLRAPMATLVGARPTEVVAMNSLTVNLHLMMVSFYQPQGTRTKILIEKQAFPSDRYAVESQIRFHGLDPDEHLVELGGGATEGPIDESEIEAYLTEHGNTVALVMFPGVQYATGQVFDLQRLAAAAHACGAYAGFDLAHAVGNVPVQLHDSGCDFAVWCSYKYLNAGPGAVAGCFVHERHSRRTDLPRLHGWWGNDPDSRFLMGPEFIPAVGADTWQLSNPPVMAMAPLRVSLQLFDEAGMTALRQKSLQLTGYLHDLVEERLGEVMSVTTPREPSQRGCQLSLRVKAGRDSARALFDSLEKNGFIGDWREPDIIRIAPVPLYNTFEEAWRFVDFIVTHVD
jgi:kynureninase